MAAIYRDTLRILGTSWWVVLGLAALMTALPMVLGSDRGSTSGTFMAQIVYAYAVHRYCLCGEPMTLLARANPARPPRMVGFLLVSGGYVLALVALAFGAAMLIVPDLRSEAFLVLIYLLVTVANLLALSLFGTLLPAAAVGDPLGPAFGAGRLRATFWPIFGGLIVGPGIVGLAGLVLLVLASRSVGPEAGQAGAFAIDTAGYALGLVNTTFAVVVLCRAYRSVVPADPAPAMAAT